MKRAEAHNEIVKRYAKLSKDVVNVVRSSHFRDTL